MLSINAFSLVASAEAQISFGCKRLISLDNHGQIKKKKIGGSWNSGLQDSSQNYELEDQENTELYIYYLCVCYIPVCLLWKAATLKK